MDLERSYIFGGLNDTIIVPWGHGHPSAEAPTLWLPKRYGRHQRAPHLMVTKGGDRGQWRGFTTRTRLEIGDQGARAMDTLTRTLVLRLSARPGSLFVFISF